MVEAYLAIDEGTTNCKAVLVDTHGAVLSTGSSRLDLHLPAPGWFEQDGSQIIDALGRAIHEAIAGAPTGTRIISVAVANQRESVLAFDRATGEPLSAVIGWQDSRTTDRCAAISTPELRQMVRERTGLSLDPMYSATKIGWIKDSLESSRRNRAVIGTIDSFLLHHLTGGATIACDATNAARTLLLNLKSLEWDHDLLEAFDISPELLPPVHASGGDFGVTVDFGELSAGTPIKAVLGDSHAALFGQRCEMPGEGKVTFGTGSSVMVPISGDSTRHSTVDTTLGYALNGPIFAREGNILSSGAALDTMAGLLSLDGGAALTRLAGSVPDSGGIHVVPAFSGLAAPHWDRSAVGIVTGLGRDTTSGQVARATLEAVAHQIADIVDEIRKDDPVTLLRADGGASVDPLMMQIQADIIDCPIETTERAELAALGAARMAAHSSGRGAEFDSASPSLVRYEPRLSAEARARHRDSWADAVARSRGRALPRERIPHV
ncbi:MAG TPA: glycerol kinase [Actinomycetales bacterium]|nr:glycerol kinase [Actinomycetales bacterium]